MKILHVIPSLNPRKGGPVVGVSVLAKECARHGDSTEVVCLDPPSEPFLNEFPGVVHALGPSWRRYAFNKNFVKWLRTNASSYDAVVVNGLWQFHSFGTWLALRGSATPYFVFAHGMLGGWFKKKYPLKQIKKWMYWPWADYRVLRDASGVLFTCAEEMAQAKESFWLYRCEGVVVGFGAEEASHAVVQSSDAWRVTSPALLGKRIVLFLGRLHPVKGCELAVRAFAQVAPMDPSLHLVMAGPDEVGLSGYLNELAEELGVADRISWVGMLHNESKWDAIRAAEVLFAPSHHENFGVAIVEALSCYRPVLISNKVNIWSEIVEDDAGLVGDDTVLGAAGLLKSWLALPEDKRAQMRLSARACFDKRFSVAVFAEKFRGVLQERVASRVSELTLGTCRSSSSSLKGCQLE